MIRGSSASHTKPLLKLWIPANLWVFHGQNVYHRSRLVVCLAQDQSNGQPARLAFQLAIIIPSELSRPNVRMRAGGCGQSLGGIFPPFWFDKIRDSFLFEASTDLSYDPLNDIGGRHSTLFVCMSEDGPQTVQFIVFMFCHDELGCVAWTRGLSEIVQWRRGVRYRA
jgi:hypothetical protein